jgi:hypothetical protein
MTGRKSTNTDDHLCLKAFYKFRNEKEVIPIAFGSAIPLLSKQQNDEWSVETKLIVAL